MSTNEVMLRQIDALRERMHVLSRQVDVLSDPQIVHVSRLLDRKIVNYQKSALEKKKFRA